MTIDSISIGNEIVQFLGESLKPLGFRKRRRAWYLDTPETILIVDMQRSSWSESYTLNLGVFVKALDTRERSFGGSRPNLVDCHVRYDLSDLFPEPPKRPAKITQERARVHELLDVELVGKDIDPRQRALELRQIVDDRLLPFLELCKTETGIRKVIAEVLGFWDMVSGDLRKRLDIPDELFGSSRARRRPARA